MTLAARRRANPQDSEDIKRATRGGRQRGCSIYIRSEALLAAGIQPGGPLPYYKLWGAPGGSVLVRLYKEG